MSGWVSIVPVTTDLSPLAAAARAAFGDAVPPAPRYRTVLELRFLPGYTLRQAVAALGTSVGNAKVLQHRAPRLAAKPGTGEPAGVFGLHGPGGKTPWPGVRIPLGS
ncbi:hypothetical protein KO481_28440 [Nocardia sp. NEAU-G5]|uniref:RNA polymerase sigma-70 region 4 domain-containing protein n=1 Tax=Nocardia albiluteola TaxID=2842303 RepID=A0ABS6B8G0_9NOCA|nr:hypothetical protein [Nocardia albiluteola]